MALIDEKLLAKSDDCEALDLEEFEKLLKEEKPGFGPNLDFFTYDELKELIDKYNREKGRLSLSMISHSDVESRASRRSSVSARSSASMAELFEKNLASSGTAKTTQKKRRQTKLLEGATKLSKQNVIVARVYE